MNQNGRCAAVVLYIYWGRAAADRLPLLQAGRPTARGDIVCERAGSLSSPGACRGGLSEKLL